MQKDPGFLRDHATLRTAYSFNILQLQHPISGANVCLNVGGVCRVNFDLFPQGCHEHSKRRHVAFQGISPNLLCDKGIGQNLSHVLCQKA